MIVKKSLGNYVFDICNYILLIALTLVTLYPLLYVLFASFSDSNLLQGYSGILVKSLGFSTYAYKAVLHDISVWTGYGNTMFLVAVGTSMDLLFTSLAAYVLSRKNFYLRRPITLMIIFTMFFSGGLIPTFLLVKGIGLYNSLWACILPGLVSTWNFMLMRTYFEGIPVSLEESAKLDGANDIGILFRIVLPLSTPIIAVMVLFYGVGHWNSWFNAMIYLRDRAKFPLQLILREILLANNTDDMTGTGSAVDKENIGESIKYATTMVATIPILCVYPFLQKYFVKGVLIGAVKG